MCNDNAHAHAHTHTHTAIPKHGWVKNTCAVQLRVVQRPQGSDHSIYIQKKTVQPKAWILEDCTVGDVFPLQAVLTGVSWVAASCMHVETMNAKSSYVYCNGYRVSSMSYLCHHILVVVVCRREHKHFVSSSFPVTATVCSPSVVILNELSYCVLHREVLLFKSVSPSISSATASLSPQALVLFARLHRYCVLILCCSTQRTQLLCAPPQSVLFASVSPSISSATASLSPQAPVLFTRLHLREHKQLVSSSFPGTKVFDVFESA